MGRPPCTRVFAYSTASSSTRWAAPTISAVRASAPACRAPRRAADEPRRSSALTAAPSNATSKSFSGPMTPSGHRAMPRRSAGTRRGCVSPPPRAGAASAPAPRAAHRLDEQDDVEQRALAAAELGRNQQPLPAELRHAPPQGVVHASRIERHALHPLGRTVLLQEVARGGDEQLLGGRGTKVHQAFLGSAGRPRTRTATVVRSTSAVPPAIVWPRLVRYACEISPSRRASREPARSGAHGPSRSMPSRASF